MSFSARSNGSPYPVNGDPFEDIIAYPGAYIGLKKVCYLDLHPLRYQDLFIWQIETMTVLDVHLLKHLITATKSTLLHLLTKYIQYL